MIHQHGPPWPPSVHDFYPPGVGSGPWITKITVLLWLGAAAVIVFFPVAYRRPQLVPNRRLWLALRPPSVGSWLLAVVLTVFEARIALLQAYVFVMLTASYLE